MIVGEGKVCKLSMQFFRSNIPFTDISQFDVGILCVTLLQLQGGKPRQSTR